MKGPPSVLLSDFNDFGAFLKYLRRRAQLTQTELAIACGYSTPHISHLENNQRLPDHATLLALFVPALDLENEPQLVARLLELAKNARGDNVSESKQPVSAPAMPIINALPLDVRRDMFRGRTSEKSKIFNWLIECRRVITIYGRAGVGKTALACNVLAEMERAPVEYRPDGMVYLGAGVNSATGIGLDRILNDFSRLMDEESRTAAERVWRNLTATPEQRVSALLDSLKSRRYILLLDNLETCQHSDTYHFTDPMLATFFHVVLERGGPISVLVTSRYPLNLPNRLRGHEQQLPLEEGLPLEDAIALIRNLDDGKTTLPATDTDPLLIHMIEVTGGFPRALEALVGYLKGGGLRTLSDLVADKQLLAGEVTSVIVHDAIQQLTPEALRAMEGLALLGRPVTFSVLDFLLAPYIESSRLRLVIEQLVNRCFVQFNRVTHMLTLHRLDSDYCLERIPVGSPDEVAEDSLLSIQQPEQIAEGGLYFPYTRYALNYRAALCFEGQRKPQAEWQTLDDLMPQLAEFEYRIRAEDYDSAARLLLTFDVDYLRLWGKWQTMLALHKQLEGKISDKVLLTACLGNLGALYYSLDAMQLALGYYEQSLGAALEIGDRHGEGRALNRLGSIYNALGEFQRAIEYYEQGLTIAYEIGNQDRIRDALNDLGDAYWALGDSRRAIEYFEQGLAIAREIGYRRGEIYPLNTLAICYRALGEFERAIGYCEQSLAITHEVGNRQGEGYALLCLGGIYTDMKDYPAAIHHLNASYEIHDEIGYLHGKHLAKNSLAKVYLYAGDLVEARAAADIARQYEMPKTAPNIAALYGCILMALREREKAQSAFTDCVRYANDLLTKTAQYYPARYARSLACAGLVLLTHEPLDTVLDDYCAALTIFSGKGIVQDQLRLLETLISCPGGELLFPIRDVLVQTLKAGPAEGEDH